MNTQDNKVEFIRRITSGLECPKNFKCIRNNFEDICSAKYNKDKDLLLCLEEGFLQCDFMESSIDGNVCTCALRRIAFDVLRTQKQPSEIQSDL